MSFFTIYLRRHSMRRTEYIIKYTTAWNFQWCSQASLNRRNFDPQTKPFFKQLGNPYFKTYSLLQLGLHVYIYLKINWHWNISPTENRISSYLPYRSFSSFNFAWIIMPRMNSAASSAWYTNWRRLGGVIQEVITKRLH